MEDCARYKEAEEQAKPVLSNRTEGEEQTERVLFNRKRLVVEHSTTQKAEHATSLVVEHSTSQEVEHPTSQGAGYAKEHAKRVWFNRTRLVVEHSTTQKAYDYEVEVEEESRGQ
jgi:hypothetical protein